MSTTQTKGLTKSELKEIEFAKIEALDFKLLLEFLADRKKYLIFSDAKQTEQVIDYLEGEDYTVIEGDIQQVVDYVNNWTERKYPNAPVGSQLAKIQAYAYKVLELDTPMTIEIRTGSDLNDEYLSDLLAEKLSRLSIHKVIEVLESL